MYCDIDVVSYCLQTVLSWSSFLPSYCKVDNSQSAIDIVVDLQLFSELDKTTGLSDGQRW